MKYIVLGLFSLCLLGFAYAQVGNSKTTPTPHNNTSNTTSSSNATHYNSSTSTPATGPITPQTQATAATTMAATGATGVGGGNAMTTTSAPNGQGGVLTSVSLLLASFTLHALWP